jgi:protein-tyrosine-phosphatase
LRVLEDAGVLSRSRSEADGRRSYVRLVPGAFDRLAPDPLPVPGRIVFVCTANSARSQLAEALWRHTTDVPVASAGTTPADAVNEGAVRAASRNGLDLTGGRPQTVAEVVRDDDFVVTVCDRAHESLNGVDDLHWSIPDPARVGTDEAFDTTFEDLRLRVVEFAGRMLPAAS